MQTQQDLFTKPKTIIIRSQDMQNEHLQSLKSTRDLWDMRAWHKFHDIEEVRAYVREPSHKNSGHAAYCVLELKNQGIPEETIVAAIMSNWNRMFSYRLCPCLLIDPKEHCSRYKEAGNYSDTKCELCQKLQEVKKCT